MERLIQVENIVKSFRDKKQQVVAVDHVSLHLDKGEILGIIGESGSGKSTVLRLLSGIMKPDEGAVMLFDKPLDTNDRRRFRDLQMIFQDARASFDKQYTIEQSLNEVRKHLNPTALENRFLLQEVGLDISFANKYPHEMSGGECQRAAIARALACDPKVLLCDEITSALDVITQEKICSLLTHLCHQHHISAIFVSHDLPLVSNLCDRVMIMKDGKVVEEGKTKDVMRNPQHPYTKELLRHILKLETAE